MTKIIFKKTNINQLNSRLVLGRRVDNLRLLFVHGNLAELSLVGDRRVGDARADKEEKVDNRQHPDDRAEAGAGSECTTLTLRIQIAVVAIAAVTIAAQPERGRRRRPGPRRQPEHDRERIGNGGDNAEVVLRKLVLEQEEDAKDDPGLDDDKNEQARDARVATVVAVPGANDGEGKGSESEDDDGQHDDGNAEEEDEAGEVGRDALAENTVETHGSNYREFLVGAGYVNQDVEMMRWSRPEDKYKRDEDAKINTAKERASDILYIVELDGITANSLHENCMSLV